MEEINASIDFDRKLATQDIAGSKAHVAMLARQGIVEAGDADAIATGLAHVQGEIEAGKFSFSRALEDIHMNVEAGSRESIGAAAGRLHTARSRNDQVATDFRLWVRDAIDAARPPIAALQLALRRRAEKHADMVMPGFTHMQSAQPVTFGHHLLAYVEMFGARPGRFEDARKRINECPLGAAALAGTSFPIDRDDDRQGARLRPADANSLDASATATSRWKRWPPHDRGGPSVALRGRNRALVDAAFRLCQAVRRLHDRLVDHAAEAQSRRGRTGARQDRPDGRRALGLLTRDEGPAAGLLQGHAGRQGAARSTRSETLALCWRHDRHGRDLTPEPRSA